MELFPCSAFNHSIQYAITNDEDCCRIICTTRTSHIMHKVTVSHGLVSMVHARIIFICNMSMRTSIHSFREKTCSEVKGYWF